MNFHFIITLLFSSLLLISCSTTKTPMQIGQHSLLKANSIYTGPERTFQLCTPAISNPVIAIDGKKNNRLLLLTYVDFISPDKKYNGAYYDLEFTHFNFNKINREKSFTQFSDEFFKNRLKKINAGNLNFSTFSSHWKKVNTNSFSLISKKYLTINNHPAVQTIFANNKNVAIYTLIQLPNNSLLTVGYLDMFATTKSSLPWQQYNAYLQSINLLNNNQVVGC